MDDDEQRDPLARLRAADPGAAAEPRDGFADEVIARATDRGAGTGAPVADLEAERARRRPWLQVAAVAASLVVVGGLGYGLGAGAVAGPSGDVSNGAAPPISLPAGPDAASSEQAVPEPAPGDGARTDLSYPVGGGRNSFSASGLSTEDGTAAAYAFDPRAVSVEDQVASLAAALGVEGEPQLVDGSWTVGPQDGTAPTLGVMLDGTLSFWFGDPRINPWDCAVASDGVETCEPTGSVPGVQAAIDALRGLLESAGEDPAAYEFTSETWDGAVTRTAQAWPVVDGQRIDRAWSVELSDEGMVSASGNLAELVPMGEYPLVSEQDAFERLSDPRFSSQITTLPYAARDEPAVATPEEWVPPTEPPAAPTPGAAVSWPVNRVEIVEARLGLASQWQPDGGVLVVPAYEFTDADGGTWSVIAVDESKLDFSTE